MKKNNSIGIFDSGVGGTSIWKEINQLLPYENTIYLADSANAPYGNKSIDEIISLSIKNTELLLKLNCKIIVVACNTATTNSISVLREKFDIPIIGIEPAIKPAALSTQSNSIGVLATKGTLSSCLFSESTKDFTKKITITEVVGKGLVSLIESGKINSQETFSLLQSFMKPMIEAKIDHLVLGCSHYPYLIPQLKNILPKQIKIIDSGEAVARQTENILVENKLISTNKLKPVLQFYSNTNIDVLKQLLVDYSNIISVEKKAF